MTQLTASEIIQIMKIARYRAYQAKKNQKDRDFLAKSDEKEEEENG